MISRGIIMDTELKFLLDITKDAEAIVSEHFSVSAKGGESDLVTDLDIKIENFLIEKIRASYPDFDIVSEENNFQNAVTENCFVIDPIDGTINFANHLPLWVIQIACKKNGKTVASVIDFPKLKLLFYADSSGAYLNGNTISVHQVDISHTLYAIDGNNNLPAMQRMRKYSSGRRNFGGVGISMAFVAAGYLHGAVYRSDKPWDYEPGLFLVQMAGGATESVSGFHAAAMNKEFLKILKSETAKIVNSPNIFVLHSLNGDTVQTWGSDLRTYFSEKDVDVFMPNFPIRENSSYEKFDEILSTYLERGTLNTNSIVVCHSIANPYFIRFAREHKFLPKYMFAVAPGSIYRYPVTRSDYIVKVKAQAYLKPQDFEYGKKIKMTCLYSEEDDKNLEKFERFIADFGATPVFIKGYNHFDGYHKIYKIPELYEMIESIIR